jgi:hypothetical protein
MVGRQLLSPAWHSDDLPVSHVGQVSFVVHA